MALTADQQASIRRHLGYPDVVTDPDYRLEGAFDAVSAEGEAQIVTLLGRIDAAETRMAGAGATEGIIAVETVRWSDGGPMQGLAATVTRWARQIAMILGVPMRAGPRSRFAPTNRG